MNFVRLTLAQNKVGGKALRKILMDNLPAGGIRKALKIHGKPIPAITADQTEILRTHDVDKFDITLSYKLIRYISRLPGHQTTWGTQPKENPRDTSLAANVERLRIFRNKDVSHSPNTELSHGRFFMLCQELLKIFQDIDKEMGSGPVFEKQLGDIMNQHIGKDAIRNVIDTFHKDVELRLKDMHSDIKEDLCKTSETLQNKLHAIMSGEDKNVRILDSIDDHSKKIKAVVDERFAQLEARIVKTEQHTTACKDTLAAIVSSESTVNSKALDEKSKAMDEWVKHLNIKEDRTEKLLQYIIDYINDAGQLTSSDWIPTDKPERL